MKIAMIGAKRVPSREGGVEVVVEELAVRMVQAGHRVDVYNRCGGHVSGKGLPVYHGKSYQGIRLIFIPTLQAKGVNALIYSWLATIRALFGQYDVIHFHASGSCVALPLAKMFGIRTVATLHGIDSKRSKWGGLASAYLRLGERMAARYADELIVLSEGNRDYIRINYGRDCRLIPNGISKPVPAKKETVEEMGLVPGGYLLFLGRIVPEKGLHYLIEAYRKIQTDIPLVIAGGTSHTEDYMESIRAIAQKDPRIRMVGFVEGEQLHALFQYAQVFVLPSDLEGMPMALLEAMSYGNCCLVSDIQENSRVVGGYGVCFHRGDVEDLRAKLKLLLEDSSCREHYGSGAADHVLSTYNWDIITQQTLQLYQKTESEVNR